MMHHSHESWEALLQLSVIVPFHRNLDFLRRCLEALRRQARTPEVIVVADAAVDRCQPVAAEYGARVLEIDGPSGPAVARNRGAAIARGDVLVFVDADVVVAPGSLDRLSELFAAHGEIAAAFGAYDDAPAASNFISQYKNLAHSYIHQASREEANTFWAGFGAVRASVFAAVGGFDERFERPSIEDIDLGYRLAAGGYRIRLDASLRACHLKRWTLRSMVASDVYDRGIPWTQLILRFGRFQNDLNLRSAYRACVVLSYLLLGLLPLVFFEPLLLVPAAILVTLLVLLSRRFYTYFVNRRGVWFAVRVFPLHYLYHLYNGLSFTVGTTLYLLQKRLSIELPGALPLTPWTGPAPRPAKAPSSTQPVGCSPDSR